MDQSIRGIRLYALYKFTTYLLTYGTSLAIWDHSVLPATRQKWTRPTITPAKQADTRFTYPRRMEGWVDLGSLLVAQLGIEPTTAWSHVRCPNRHTTKWPWCQHRKHWPCSIITFKSWHKWHMTAWLFIFSFRVVTYNILADIYADSDFSRDFLFPHCPAEILSIDYRKQLLLKELRGRCIVYMMNYCMLHFLAELEKKLWFFKLKNQMLCFDLN